MVTFCAVIMAKEDKSVIDRVVDYYIANGAAKVLVYMDGEPDFIMDDRGGRLRCIVCDEDFWKPITDGTPVIHNVRQVEVYKHAVTEVAEDWTLFVDCDEYLVCDHPIAALLDQIPPSEDIVRIPNIEAVWGPGDNHDEFLGARWFRRSTTSPFKRLAIRLIYGEAHRFMGAGLLGHSAGKHFVRSGREYDRISAHTSRHKNGRPGKWVGSIFSGEVFVCHFDALNYELWRRKFARRFRNKSRHPDVRQSREQMFDLFAENAKLGDPHLRRLFKRLYCISPWQAFALKTLGLALRHDIFE